MWEQSHLSPKDRDQAYFWHVCFCLGSFKKTALAGYRIAARSTCRKRVSTRAVVLSDPLFSLLINSQPKCIRIRAATISRHNREQQFIDAKSSCIDAPLKWKVSKSFEVFRLECTTSAIRCLIAYTGSERGPQTSLLLCGANRAFTFWAKPTVENKQKHQWVNHSSLTLRLDAT